MNEKETTPIKRKKTTKQTKIKDNTGNFIASLDHKAENLYPHSSALECDSSILNLDPDHSITPGKLVRSHSCTHPNLVPLEVSFIRITHPTNYKELHVEFNIGISLATAFRVRKYFCPVCREIIKAPSIYAEEK